MSGRAGARLGLTIVGAIAGFFTPIGAGGGALIGSLIGAVAFPDKPIKQFQRIGASLQDQRVTLSEYGAPIPEYAGTNRVGLNVIWARDVYTEVMRTRTSSGGKGGGGGTSTTTEVVRNFTDVLCLMANTPVQDAGDVLQIFRLGDLIFDQKMGNGADNPLADRLAVTFLPGGIDQLPPALIERFEGVGNVPAYRRKACVLIEHLEVTAAPVFVQGLQAVLNSGARQPEVLTDTAGPTGTTAIGSVIVADFDRGFFYSVTAGGDIVQWRISDLTQVRVLEPDVPSFPIAIDPFDGSIVVSDNDTARRIDNLTGDTLATESYGLAERIEQSAFAFVITATLPAGKFGAILSPGAGIYKGYDLEGLGFIRSIAVGSQSVGGGAGFPGAGFGYFAGQSSTEYNLFKATLVPDISTDPITGIVELGSDLNFSAIRTITPDEVDPTATVYSLLGSRVFVDASTNRIFFGVVTDVGEFIVGYSEEEDIFARIEVPQAPFELAGSGSDRFLSGSIVYTTNVGANRLVRINAQSGTLDQAPLDGSVPGYGVGGVVPDEFVFDDGTNSLFYVGASGSLHQFTLNGRTVAPVSVGSIIEERCLRAGLDPLGPNVKIDPDLYTVSVGGFECIPPYTAAGSIETLAKAFQFDGRQSGAALEFVTRGGASVATLDYQEFLVEDGEAEPYKLTRVDEQSLPAAIQVRYRDADKDYQTNMAMDRRPDPANALVRSVRTEVFDFTGVLTATQAKQIAQRAAIELEIGREGLQAQLGPENDHLDAADPVTVSLVDRTQRFRLVEHNIGADDTVQAQFVREEAGQFESIIDADGGSAQPQTPVLPPSADAVLFSVPYLQDVDSPGNALLIIYWVALAFEEFAGVTLFGGPDDDTLEAVSAAVAGAPFGTAENALADPGEFQALDTGNTLTVTMGFGGDQLETITMDELEAGGNAFALIKANGQADIGQFMTVTSLGDDRYTLSNLLQHRRGTDTIGLDHAAGDRFVLLTREAVQAFTIPASLRDTGRVYKAVTVGQRFDRVRSFGFTSPGNDLKPYALLNFSAEINGSGNIEISAERRTRIGGDSIGGPAGDSSLPLSEFTEKYAFDFFSTADPDRVVRTDAVNTTTRTSTSLPFVYTAAQYNEDFGTSIPGGAFTLIFRGRQVGGQMGDEIDGFFIEQSLTVGGISTFDDIFTALDFPSPFGGHGVRVDGDATFSDEDLLEILRLFGDL